MSSEDYREPQPGDLCRLLGAGLVEHWGCGEHPDGTVTHVATGEVIRTR